MKGWGGNRADAEVTEGFQILYPSVCVAGTRRNK